MTAPTTDRPNPFAGVDDAFHRARIFKHLQDIAEKFPEKLEGFTHAEDTVNYPDTDVYREDDNLILEIDLPGVARESIDVGLKDEVLTVKASREALPEAVERLSTRVRRGDFERAVKLPKAVDATAIHASYGNGVLVVSVDNAFAPEKPEPIKVDVRD